MRIIGLTGGIGSGKSTISQFFKLLGIATYNADDKAKYLMAKDESLKHNIIALLGEMSYIEGVLNNRWIGEQVFSNPELLIMLNKIVHPAVKDDFNKWIQTQNGPYVLREAAILFESNSYTDCYKTILVFAPVNIRIQRVVKRDSLSEVNVINRMKNQWSDDSKIKLASYVINNFENSLIIPQVLKIHGEIIE